jgi:hypothetical protein
VHALRGVDQVGEWQREQPFGLLQRPVMARLDAQAGGIADVIAAGAVWHMVCARAESLVSIFCGAIRVVNLQASHRLTFAQFMAFIP